MEKISGGVLLNMGFKVGDITFVADCSYAATRGVAGKKVEILQVGYKDYDYQVKIIDSGEEDCFHEYELIQFDESTTGREREIVLNNGYLDMTRKQLAQVFEYAELATRLNDLLELLDPNGGYNGEKDIYQGIVDLKEKVYDQLKIHMRNSKVSESAMTIINNIRHTI